jgi:CheY-like chemotaxis protein
MNASRDRFHRECEAVAGRSRLPAATTGCLLVSAKAYVSEPRAKSAGASEGAKPVIYVVDDEAMLLELAAVILEPLGYEIQTFRDPESALRNFTRARPRPVLLITDFAMHQMDGMELAEACRRVEPGQKILMISGTVGPEIFQEAAVRPDRFLEKPYQARQLIEMVKSMLKN